MKEQIKSTRVKRVIKIIIAVIVLVHILPFPINKQFETFEIKLDDDMYMDECTVTIKGKYYINFFTRDKFVGNIHVSKYPLTEWEMRSVRIVSSTRESGTSLHYVNRVYNENTKRSELKIYMFGDLITKRFFYDMAIVVLEHYEYPDNTERPHGVGGGWGSDKGYYIIPSATTRDEAVQKIDEWGLYHH